MAMNLDRHVKASPGSAQASPATATARRPRRTARFYDEYFAVMDLPAEFYLETVEQVFQDHALARAS